MQHFLVRIPPEHFIEVQRCKLLYSHDGRGGLALYQGLLKYGGCLSGLESGRVPRVLGRLCKVGVYMYGSYNKRLKGPRLEVPREYWGPGLLCIFWTSGS